MSAALGEYYGPRAVWLDYDDIGPGAEFAEALTEALAQTDNLLAIIGPDWLTAEKEGRRRLDDPEDWVRREVVAGLSGRSTVTPVLVGHAQLPTVEQLPEPLQPLTARHAIEVRPEHFDSDVEDLIRRMGGWRRRWRGFPLWAWALAVTAVVGLLVVSFVVRRNMAPLISPQQVQAVAGRQACQPGADVGYVGHRGRVDVARGLGGGPHGRDRHADPHGDRHGPRSTIPEPGESGSTRNPPS